MKKKNLKNEKKRVNFEGTKNVKKSTKNVLIINIVRNLRLIQTMVITLEGG